MSSSVSEIPRLVRALYTVVGELEQHFPGRKFTLDGHLVGSIGEVLAAHRYNLKLLPASAQGHDATSSDGRLVQVKATQGKSIALRSEPQHLLVLVLDPEGNAHEVFNGPGSIVWPHVGRSQSIGQRSIGVSKLRTLMKQVAPSQRLPAAA